MPKSKFSNENLTRWKREINPAPIIKSRVPTLHRENTEWVGCCPDIYHKKNLGKSDKNPSLKFWKEDGGVWIFKCFSCGETGNLFQFIKDFDNISFAQAVEKVLSEAGVDGWQDGEEQTDTNMPDEPKKEFSTFSISEYTPAIVALERSQPAQNWLTARGITMETARKFKLGFVQSAEKVTSKNDWLTDGWVLFPTLSEDGSVTAIKYRSLVSKKAKKSNGKENSGILRAPNTSTTIYNLQAFNPKEDVWIAEGEPDTLVLAQAGLIAVGFPMGLYKPSDEECDLLSTAKRRFFAGDNDGTGNRGRVEFEKRLSGAMYHIVWPNNRKDANDVLTNECDNDPEKFKALVEDLKVRATQTETEPILRNATEVKPKRIKWLWFEKIPLGKITLLAGNPDNGKSLASTSIAALCSNGNRYPGCDWTHTPADVLMMLGEDDLEDTAVPRLIAADANMKRIHFLEGVRPVQLEDREVKLDADIPAIERQLEANPNIRLLIIDPISNYLGDVSMVAEQEVRSILIPLKRAAEKYNVAVVIVMHLNKKNDLDAISRVGGAMAFIGVARCSWLFSRNVQEKEVSEDGVVQERLPDSFSMLRIKNNLVSSGKSGLSYSVSTKDIPVDNDAPMKTPFIVWGNVIDASADEALGSNRRQTEKSEPRPAHRPDDSLQQAIKWLGDALQDNIPKNSKTLMAEAKAGPGISEKTLRRAKQQMGIRDYKEGNPPRFFWVMDEMNEQGDHENEEEPQQSMLIEIEGEAK